MGKVTITQMTPEMELQMAAAEAHRDQLKAAGHAVTANALCTMALNGWKFGPGVTRRFVAAEIRCPLCRHLIENKGTPRRNLLAMIQEDMLKRNPKLAREDWETE